MICLLCGAKVPFFRRLSDPEYCSDAHRSEHERDMAEQALARLTRKPIPAKFAETPKEPEFELRPLTIHPLTIRTDEVQREPGEFGSRTSAFLVRPPAAFSQLWDFLSEADNIAWTAALHIPSFLSARSFTGLRIAGRQGVIPAAAGQPLQPRSLGLEPPRWRTSAAPLALRIGSTPQLIAPRFALPSQPFAVPSERPDLKLDLKLNPAEAAWRVLAAPLSALAEAELRVAGGAPRFGVLLPLVRRPADGAHVTAGLAPRANSFLHGVVQPLSPTQGPRANQDALRLGLARVEKVKFDGLINFPHALPEAGFASLVKPVSVAVMRPPSSVPGFPLPRLARATRIQTNAAQPRLTAAAFTPLQAASAAIPGATAKLSVGVALLSVQPPTLPSFNASIARPRRMSPASLESMIPQTALPVGAPLNGAIPMPFCWRAAQPPVDISTPLPAMAMVGVVRREKQNPVYAPARPRRSGSVPRPFRVSIRLGEFHVAVLEPGHPSETAPASYRPAALELEKPARRARAVEPQSAPQLPIEPTPRPDQAALNQDPLGSNQVESDLRRRLAAEASPLPVSGLLDRIRGVWAGIPKLARAAVFAAPALAALILYVQGTETNVAAGGGVVDTPAPQSLASSPSTPVPVRVSVRPVASAPAVSRPPEPAAAPSPAPAPPESASLFSLASFRTRIRKRASVYVDEDFRDGLLRWNGEDTWDKSWAIDRNYLASPGKLALLEPTLELENYRFEFLGQIVKKSLSFVYRAKDRDNYYAGRINLLTARGAQNGKLSVSRWVVIDGEELDRKEVQLPGTVDLDAMYRVLVLVQRDHFTVHINGEMADYFDDSRLPMGGIGFFSEKGAVSKLLWAKVIDHDDFLGTVCSLLSPKTVDRRTLNRDTSGKDSASR